MKKRVVITGHGVLSSLGSTPAELFENLRAGKSGVIRTEENAGPLLCAPVPLNENAVRRLPRQARRSMGRLAHLSALAALDAVRESGLPEETLSSGSAACVIGSTIGSVSALDESYRIMLLGRGIEEMPALQFFKCASHTAAFNTAALLGIAGCVYAPSAACASGLQAIGLAYNLIASGTQTAAVCGGADEFARSVSGSFELMMAAAGNLSFPPDEISRPFDAARSGLVCGEGAGILVLEELEHAERRGAGILAEIEGYATNSCPKSVSQSDAGSIQRCIELLYRNAGADPESTSCINAHATGTLQGDAAEAEALRRVFGSSVPVSSLKGHLGHTLGASGAIELCAVLEMMRRGEIIPTRNLTRAADDCAGLDHVLSLRPARLDRVLKNCFALGGINATLLLANMDLSK